jgi:ADP-ribose diphosphatase
VRFTNLVQQEEGWETKTATTHWADKHLSVATESVKTPSREKARPWTIVHRKAAVVIAPITGDGRFLLIRQERVPIKATIWEMPAGQIDDNAQPNDTEIRAVALRELHEETGHDLAAGGELIPLGDFFSSPGFTDEHCYFFLARSVVPAAVHAAEEGEGIIDCRGFTPEELVRMIADNEIRDSNTLSICARLAARGYLSFQSQS